MGFLFSPDTTPCQTRTHLPPIRMQLAGAQVAQVVEAEASADAGCIEPRSDRRIIAARAKGRAVRPHRRREYELRWQDFASTPARASSWHPRTWSNEEPCMDESRTRDERISRVLFQRGLCEDE